MTDKAGDDKNKNWAELSDNEEDDQQVQETQE